MPGVPPNTVPKLKKVIKNIFRRKKSTSSEPTSTETPAASKPTDAAAAALPMPVAAAPVAALPAPAAPGASQSASGAPVLPPVEKLVVDEEKPNEASTTTEPSAITADPPKIVEPSTSEPAVVSPATEPGEQGVVVPSVTKDVEPEAKSEANSEVKPDAESKPEPEAKPDEPPAIPKTEPAPGMSATSGPLEDHPAHP